MHINVRNERTLLLLNNLLVKQGLNAKLRFHELTLEM